MSVSPQPQSFPLGPFQICLKICGDIHKSRCTTSVNDTGGKFAAGINDTGGKFTTGQRHWRQILPPVSLVLLIPVTNLPPILTIPCQQNWWQFAAGITDTGDKFATGVNDAGGK
jgi:hypothetical protein